MTTDVAMLEELMQDPGRLKAAFEALNQESPLPFTENSTQPLMPPAPAYEPILAYIDSGGLYHVNAEARPTGILGYFDLTGKLHMGEIPLLSSGPDQWDSTGRLISHSLFTDQF